MSTTADEFFAINCGIALSTKQQEPHHNLCVTRGTTIHTAEAIEQT
jgi:hypothetical protein